MIIGVKRHRSVAFACSWAVLVASAWACGPKAEGPAGQAEPTTQGAEPRPSAGDAADAEPSEPSESPDLPVAVPDLPPPPPPPDALGEDPLPVEPEDAPTPKAAAQLERSGDFARDLVDAIRLGDADAVVAMTPYGNETFKKLCGEGTLVDGEPELRARVNHCIKRIPWSHATDVQIRGAELEGDADDTCKAGVQRFSRFAALVVTSQGDFLINVRDVWGRKGKAEAFGGNIACERRP